MTAARKLTVDDLSDEELDRLADLLDKRRAERREAKRRAAPPILESTEVDLAEGRRIARRLGLRIKGE